MRLTKSDWEAIMIVIMIISMIILVVVIPILTWGSIIFIAGWILKHFGIISLLTL